MFEDNQQLDDETHLKMIQNKQKILQQYGVNFQIPAFYIQDAKLYPRYKDYVIMVVNYIVPQNDLKIVTHGVYEPPTEEQRANGEQGVSIYSNQHLTEPVEQALINTKDMDGNHDFEARMFQYCSLKLMKKVKEAFIEVKEVVIEPDDEDKKNSKDSGKKISIEFSPSGEYLAILARKENVLKIYKIEEDFTERDEEDESSHDSGLMKLFEDIEQNIPPHLTFDDNTDLNCKLTKRLEFDARNRYLIVYGLMNLNVIPLQQNTPEIVQHLEISPKIFTDIIDCQLVSNSDEANDYRCEVAVHVKDEQSVAIIDLFESLDQNNQINYNKQRKITYFNEDITYLDVKISEDFASAVLVNQTENYILFFESEEWHQNSLIWLNGKQIRSITSYQDQFLFVCCKEYDRSIDIMSSSLSDFKISIRRKIEPNTLRVFDFLQELHHPNGIGEAMNIISMRDQEFFYDKIEPMKEYENIRIKKENLEKQRKGDEELEELHQTKKESYKFTKYRGFGSLWPYVAFQGMEPHINYLWLIKAYDEDKIHRILMPNEHQNIQIVKSYVSESNDLFVVCETQNGYNIYKIDLEVYEDDEKTIQFYFPQLISDQYPTYFKSEVNHKTFNRFQARSASKASDANQIFKQIIFLYHGTVLYSLLEGQTAIEPVCDALDFDKISDDRILVQVKNENPDLFQLDEVRIEINEIKNEYFYSEKLVNENMNTFAYDQQGKILLTMRAPSKKGYRQKSIKIYDKANENTLWNGKVYNTELIGRLKTQFYQFIDGHIYYNNNVIKIRYDLLNKKNIKDMSDFEVFDYYDNLFEMNPGDQFLTDMPIQMQVYHRLLYILFNQKELGPNQVTFTPFLHERKVYLSRMDENCEYFFNTHQYECPGTKHKSLHSSFGGEIDWKMDTDFITVNFSEKKVYRYNSNGILRKVFEFADKVKSFGKPVSVSANGHLFIFKKKRMRVIHIFLLAYEGFQFLKSIDITSAIEKFITDLENSDERHDSTGTAINLKHSIQEEYNGLIYEDQYAGNIKFQINDNLDVIIVMSYDFQKKKKEKEQQEFKSKKQNLAMQMFQDNVLSNLDQKRGSVIYIQKGSVGTQLSKYLKNLLAQYGCGIPEIDDTPCKGQHLILTKTDGNYINKNFENGFTDFSINKEYCFFWNVCDAWYVLIDFYNQSLEEQETKEYFRSINLHVDKNDKVTQIKKIRTGSNSNEVAILIKQSIQSDCVITWDILKDDEMESFDMNQNPKIFFDKDGKCCLTEDNLVCITQQGIKLTSYDVSSLNRDKKGKNDKNLKFGFHYGHKFDSVNFEWLYLRDYVLLPYSYMTFVIKSKIYGENEHYIQDDYRFDIEQYNYLYEGKTCFTDDIETVTDHDRLQYILSNFEETDMVLLEQIQFYHYEIEEQHAVDLDEEDEDFKDKWAKLAKKKTPLHIAMDQKNNRSVRILLKYMALIDSNCSETYKDIIHLLVDYTGFSDYLDQLPLQTIQMANKQTLRIQKAENSDIVANNSSHTSYIDQVFYTEKMHEDLLYEESTFKSYPVKVMALRVQWILFEKEGTNFLQAIYQSENIELYDIPAIQIIIQFLYKQYRQAIIKLVLPVYIAQLVCFFVMIYFAETKYTLIQMMSIKPKDGDPQIPDIVCDEACQTKNTGTDGAEFYNTLIHKEKWSAIPTIFAVLANIVVMLLLVGQFYQKGKNVGFARTKVSLVIFDGIYFIGNSICIYFILNHNILEKNITGADQQSSMVAQRTLYSFLSITIWTKSLEFLKLNDSMAPLISIISQIFIDIRYFLLTLAVSVGGFATAYYLIGKNQKQFDIPQPPSDDDRPPYDEVSKSLFYVYLQMIGELSIDTDYFAIGKKSQVYILWAIFLFSTFVLILHLMNMLIGIMTATFAETSVIADQRRTKEHLKYILDNDWMNSADALPYKSEKNISYLVTAFMNEEDEEDVEIIKDILVDTKEMRIGINKELEEVLVEIKKIKGKVNNISNQ